MKSTISLTLLITLSINSVFSQKIVQWRGENRDGIYNETGLLKEWPGNGPELLWSSENIPKGFSSPAVTNNMIYLTGKNETEDIITAIDLKGNIQWQTPYGRAWDKTYSNSRGTPTIEDDRIYLYSGYGEATCINAKNGDIVWSRKVHEEYGGLLGKWGICESLLLVDNKVFVTIGGNKTTMIALDKKTGETIWLSKSIEDRASYTSPILVERGAKKIIINVTDNNIFGVNAANGEILWKFDFGSYAGGRGGSNNHTNSPLYKEGLLYVSSGYDHKSVMLKLAEDGNSVELEWIDEVLDIHHGGAVLVDGFIYGSNWEHNRMGTWVCLDWKTGKVKYDKEWINKGSIISAEGMLYCYEEKTGYLALVKANPEKFDIISSFQIPLGTGPHWAHPVIKNGILYLRHENAIMAYDINNESVDIGNK
ncbi:PQQ-binding-like beta-propeller repeat protein [Bacteroidota bacterium]